MTGTAYLPFYLETPDGPVTPSKIICVGLNYRSHARELGMDSPGEPLIFLKPPTALTASGATIHLPGQSRRVDYEGELALVVGRRAKHLAEDEALGVLAGVTLANDVTARDLQKQDGQWTRAKGFDGFCPLGPSVLPDPDWDRLAFETFLNGERRQQGSVEDFIFPIPALVAFISRVMTLLPGDVILTGTPPGIGPVKAGDRVTVAAEGIGRLENRFA